MALGLVDDVGVDGLGAALLERMRLKIEERVVISPFDKAASIEGSFKLFAEMERSAARPARTKSEIYVIRGEYPFVDNDVETC